MLADMKSYPTYKDSGVGWLGDVPEHWEVRRIKTLLKEKDERNRDENKILLSLTRTRGIVPQQEASKRIASVEDLSKYKVCHRGDLVMNRMQAWSGMFAISSLEGVISPDYSIFNLTGVQQLRYYEYVFKTPICIDQFSKKSKGIGTGFNRLYTPDFGSIQIIAPPLPEQTAIVRYLDYMDHRIRRYINAKKKLIALLEEEKQAIIHNAVTRGLNPDVRFKPSGVEWLGDVPEHWEIRRIKSLSLVKRGASPRPIADPKYFDDRGEYSWVRIADVTASERYLENTKQRLSSIGQSLSVKLEPGSLFLSIAGSVGKPMITKIKCCIHDGFVYFPQFHGNVEFLCRIFSSNAPFSRLGKLGTQLNLNTDTVGNICVGWPPFKEQNAIVQHLDDSTQKINIAITHAQHQIALLQEYRTRLIADVVTGKLDVREAAARLPEESRENKEGDTGELLDELDSMIDDETSIEESESEYESDEAEA